MVEDLLGVGLARVNDGEAVEVAIQDLRGMQDAGPADNLLDDSRGGGDRFGFFARITTVHDRPPCGREYWELLSDDAAERQERSIAIGLRKCLPELRQRDPPARFRWRGGTARVGRCRMVILPGQVVRGEAGSNLPALRATEPRFWGGHEDRQG